MPDGWRSPSLAETKILELLVQQDFPGADVLRKQVCDLEVRRIEGEQSLELRTRHQVRFLSKHRVPVEAEYSDSAANQASLGVHVHCLLHVSGGLISELEFYKDDGTRMERLPEPSELHVFIPDKTI